MVTERVRIERETIRDTLVTIEPDSAALAALLECDSNNQVLMTRLDTEEGARLRYRVQSQSQGGKMLLQIMCLQDSISRLLQLKDKTVTDSLSRTTTEYVEVEKPIGRWNQFLIVCGWILFIAVTAAVLTSIATAIWRLTRKRS